MYIVRAVEASLLKAAGSFPCLVVYGPRQVGKSTTVNMLFGEKYRTVTLDDLEDRKLALENPRLFLETYSWPLVIDEIQKAPNLLDEIKIIISMAIKQLQNDVDRVAAMLHTVKPKIDARTGAEEALNRAKNEIKTLKRALAECGQKLDAAKRVVEDDKDTQEQAEALGKRIHSLTEQLPRYQELSERIAELVKAENAEKEAHDGLQAAQTNQQALTEKQKTIGEQLGELKDIDHEANMLSEAEQAAGKALETLTGKGGITDTVQAIQKDEGQLAQEKIS